jgi:Arc/MetJ-type ribon-helix-helix transcriptional regulator
MTQTMTRRKADPSVKLTRKLTIHLSQSYYEKLERWLSHSNCRTASELVRAILYREQINWYHKDASLESTAIELAAIRKELNAIGKNINQITHSFHATDIPNQKMFHALKVADEYKKVGNKVDELLRMVSEISKTWLQK